MTEPQQPKEDALVRMYAQASAQDPRRPAPRVADAIRTHARVVIAAGDAAAAPKPAARRDAMEAVNHPRWKTSLLASIAVIGLAGMLFLQFDRGAPQQQDLARGPQAPYAPVPMQSKDQVAQRSVLPREEPVAPSASVPVAAPETMRERNAAPAVSAKALGDAPAARPAPRARAGAVRQRDALAGAPAPAFEARSESGPAPVSALGEAARSGRVDELAAILASGASVDLRDAGGRTPLMLAAIEGHREMVRRLLAAGADPRLRDHAGQTAAQLARAAGHPQLAELIQPGS